MAGFRPQPGALWPPWRTGRQATAPPLPQGSVSAGTHLVREWNGRTYQVEVIDNGLSVRWQNLSVPHYHRKANHRHPLVRTTLFRSDAQAQGLT